MIHIKRLLKTNVYPHRDIVDMNKECYLVRYTPVTCNCIFTMFVNVCASTRLTYIHIQRTRFSLGLQGRVKLVRVIFNVQRMYCAQGSRFVMVIYRQILFISFRVTSLALGQYDCPGVSAATLKNMGKISTTPLNTVDMNKKQRNKWYPYLRELRYF